MKLSKHYNPTICENLIKFRKQHNYLEKDVAEYLGVKQQYYSKYETGEVALSVQRLIQLCELYDVSADEMLGLNEDKA